VVRRPRSCPMTSAHFRGAKPVFSTSIRRASVSSSDASG
jgi:hypothetical protein